MSKQPFFYPKLPFFYVSVGYTAHLGREELYPFNYGSIISFYNLLINFKLTTSGIFTRPKQRLEPCTGCSTYWQDNPVVFTIPYPTASDSIRLSGWQLYPVDRADLGEVHAILTPGTGAKRRFLGLSRQNRDNLGEVVPLIKMNSHVSM